jgi:chromate transporter
MTAAPSEHPRSGALRELALLFLRLGLTAFGGPAAHIAMMQQEIVERRKWLTREEFLDLLSATNFIPGPNSTEMAIHVGHRRGGWKGLLVAGTCFIVPAALLVLGFAWLYVRYGQLPQTSAVLYGIKPVIIAIVLRALWVLGRTALRSRGLAALGVACAIANAFGVNELLVLLAGGVTYSLAAPPDARAATGTSRVRALLPFGSPSVGVALAAKTASSSGIFLVFLKIGSVLFGSGYVLLAFLRADLVQARHWLTESQLLDAVAVGQVTPGPVFTTATFIGYVLGGYPGALAATLGIFAPAFVFVALSGPLLPRLRASTRAARFLDGLNAASLALMGVVTFSLARAALVDAWTLALLIASGVLLFRRDVNSAWLVLAGGVLGSLIRWTH